MAGAKSSSFDWQRLIADINQEVHRLSRLHISLLEKAGVELIQGHVTFWILIWKSKDNDYSRQNFEVGGEAVGGFAGI